MKKPDQGFIPQLTDLEPGVFKKMGFMVSEARMTAFGLLSEAVQEYLDACWDSHEGTDDPSKEGAAFRKMKETFDALMHIVAQETQVEPGKYMDLQREEVEIG